MKHTKYIIPLIIIVSLSGGVLAKLTSVFPTPLVPTLERGDDTVDVKKRVKSAYGLTDIILINNCLVDRLSADLTP